MSEEKTGVFGEMFKQMSTLGLPFRPKLEQNELTVEFTEQEFKEATTKGLDERMKNAITIKFLNGKMVIKVKLF